VQSYVYFKLYSTDPRQIKYIASFPVHLHMSPYSRDCHLGGCNLACYTKDSSLIFTYGSSRALDSFHSYIICAAIWHYFISTYGDSSAIDYIPWWVFYQLAFCLGRPLENSRRTIAVCTRPFHSRLELINRSFLSFLFAAQYGLLSLSSFCLIFFQAIVTFLVHW